MNSFELTIKIEAGPTAVFNTLTVPKLITRWDACQWASNDMKLAGKLRKRDEEGKLTEGEIVLWTQGERFGLLWPTLLDTDEPEQGNFLTRMDFKIEGAVGGSLLSLKAEGFPSTELCEREKNSWGGWYLEQVKKTAEQAVSA